MMEVSDFRCRVLEVLALIADAETQLEYQRRAPGIDVPAELFNQWDDSYHPEDPLFLSQFDRTELIALASFEEVLDGVATETPRQLPALDDFIKTEQWRRLSIGARDVLAVLKKAET